MTKVALRVNRFYPLRLSPPKPLKVGPLTIPVRQEAGKGSKSFLDENARRNYDLFQLLKAGDFNKIRAFLADNPQIEFEPLIERLVILFNSRLWGKRGKSGAILKRYSPAAWSDFLKEIFQQPETIIDLPEEILATVSNGTFRRFMTALELFNFRRFNPNIYGFSPGQIVQISESPKRAEIILRKLHQYAVLPKGLRPATSRVVKIGLSADPEERFKFLDGEIERKPKSISPMVVLAGSRDFRIPAPL